MDIYTYIHLLYAAIEYLCNGKTLIEYLHFGFLTPETHIVCRDAHTCAHWERNGCAVVLTVLIKHQIRIEKRDKKLRNSRAEIQNLFELN